MSRITFPYEVIVIDNNSNDGTTELIKSSYKKVKLIQNLENVGYGKANNQGLKIAQGRFILLLNSDTQLNRDTLTRTIEWFKKRTEVGVVGCQLLFKDERIQPSAGYLPTLSKIIFWATFIDDFPLLKTIIKPYQVSSVNFYKSEHEVGWVTGAFFLLRKEVYNETFGFDEKIYMYSEEVEWCYRIKKAGFKVFYTPLTSIYHLKSASPKDLSENAIIQEFKGLEYIFKKHKPSWERRFLPLILRLAAYLRIIRFSIINDKARTKIYEKAVRVV